jgi:hypothetical protein
MPKSRTAVIDEARRALSSPVKFDELMAKAPQKDRSNVEKHLAAVDADHANLWRRLTRSLATLAPMAIATVGQQAVQFFIADGKYRMQVFSIEDQHDGRIMVYCPDILEKVVSMKLITPDNSGEPDRYRIARDQEQSIIVEQLTASNTFHPEPHFKNMLGWNRKAVRVTITVTATPEIVDTVEDLCATAAQAWAPRTPSV